MYAAQKAALFDSPKSTNLCLLCPDIAVESVGEVIRQDWAVLVVNHGRETIVDEETSNGETGQYTDHWDDGNPLLLWILLVFPWLLNLSLLDTSAVEESLWDAASKGGGTAK